MEELYKIVFMSQQQFFNLENKDANTIYLTPTDNKGGVIGATGPAGSRWYSGSTTPSTSLGVINDYYINTTSSDIYEKTGTFVWTLRMNINGIEGPPGPPGQDGQGVTPEIQAKLTILQNNGDGTKFLSDNGTYRTIADSMNEVFRIRFGKDSSYLTENTALKMSSAMYALNIRLGDPNFSNNFKAVSVEVGFVYGTSDYEIYSTTFFTDNGTALNAFYTPNDWFSVQTSVIEPLYTIKSMVVWFQRRNANAVFPQQLLPYRM